MDSPRHKRITAVVVVAGLCTLSLTAFLLREQILERWSIYRFQSDTGEDKWARAVRLETAAGPGRRIVEEWYLEMLRSPDTAQSTRALKAVGRLALGSAVPVIIDVLHQMRPADAEGRELESACTEALLEIGEAATDPLWEALQQAADEVSGGSPRPGSTLVAFKCIRLLERLDPGRRRDMDGALVALARSSDAAISQSALQILQAEGRPAVPALLTSFQGAGVKLQLRILSVFTRLGPEAEEAVPALLEATEHGHPLVRYLSAKALRRIRGQSWH